MSELEVLRCSGCGAPLALGDADSVTCPSCKASTAVPEAYRELHRARLADAALRGQAERVLSALDRPPSLVVKLLARVLDQQMFVFLLVFGVPMGLIAIGIGLRASTWLAPHLHVKPDDVPFAYTVAAAFGALFVMTFVPRVLGVYANRRAADRSRLLRALRAHPPTVPGGPATCRACGAPLAVAADEIVATCSYCRAENAVKIETPLVEATSVQVANLGTSIAEVAARDHGQRRATRRKLVHELGRYLLRTGLLALGFGLGSCENADHKTPPLSIVATVATVLLFIYFMFKSGGDDDEAERRAGNDVPQWVGVVGALAVGYALLQVFPSFF